MEGDRPAARRAREALQRTPAKARQSPRRGRSTDPPVRKSPAVGDEVTAMSRRPVLLAAWSWTATQGWVGSDVEAITAQARVDDLIILTTRN